jgi:Ca2+-binding RTX toxin-like protein
VMGRRHMSTRIITIAGIGALAATLGAAAALAAPPPNDNFAAASVVEDDQGTLKGANIEATREAGEPDHAGRVGGASVWYRWTATRHGRLFLWLEGSDFDTLLAVYRGNGVADLTEIASNDDAPGARTSILNFVPVPGATYHIAVDGFIGATGTVQLSWSQAPPNDDVASAQSIRGLRGRAVGSTAGATREQGEQGSGLSIWYRWTAPTSSRVIFDTLKSEPEHSWYDTTLSVYTGSEPAGLTWVGDSDDFSWPLASGRSAVGFRAVAGTTYSIAVGAYGDDDMGPIVLTWRNGRIIGGTESRNTLTGTSGSDIILARRGSDTVRGGEGADLIDAGASNDIVYSGRGDDVVVGGSGDDLLHGGFGTDLLYGDGGRDRIDARDGLRRNDTADGGAGRDACFADRGDTRRNCP